MRRFYTLCFYLVLPFILLRGAWRARTHKDYLKRIGERIGIYYTVPYKECLWLHAVSYGEAVTAEALIKTIRSSFPTQQIVITTMTLTGANRILAQFRDDPLVKHLFIPYDIPFAIKRFLKQIKPQIGVIMETEIWPNLLHITRQYQVPMLLANARLSPRSLNGYKRIRYFISPLLKKFNLIAAQSEEDAQHFKALGVPLSQLKVFGNMKFDITPAHHQILQGLADKKQLPFENILVAASTHPGEEEKILNSFAQILVSHPKALLILVPRHPERFTEVAELCLKKGFTMARRTHGPITQEKTSIYLGDTMGELYYFYALADVAFVGGSLVPIGGHNLLEAAALKLPIITGEQLFNFRAITALLLQHKALQIVSDEGTLSNAVEKLFQDKAYAKMMGERAFDVLQSNKGATERHLEALKTLIST